MMNSDNSDKSKHFGIGVKLKLQGEYPKIESVIPGGSAWKNKQLQANDLIIKVSEVNGEPIDVQGWPMKDVVKLIKGEAETIVRLYVKKPNNNLVEIDLIRGETTLNDHGNPDDKLSDWETVLSFCIPLAGIIIYFSNKNTNPNKARSACYAALFGFGIGVLINLLGRASGVS